MRAVLTLVLTTIIGIYIRELMTRFFAQSHSHSVLPSLLKHLSTPRHIHPQQSVAMPTYTRQSNYGYTPSLEWTATYVSLFAFIASECALSSNRPPLVLDYPASRKPHSRLVIHTYLAIRSKYWVIFPTLILGALIECMGWAARVWSSQNVLLLTPFLMQICT
jgi:hypothetical protein